MVKRATTFTPEVLLSAPRRSAGIPNRTGASVLYTTSTYSFESHQKTTELRCLDTKSEESRLITNDAAVSEILWLEDGEDGFVCLKSGDKGSTEVLIGSAGRDAKWDDAYVAGHFAAPASSMKVAKLDGDSYAIVLAAKAYPDGSLYNPETAPKPHSTGKLYKGLFVRHWDHYMGKEKNALWYGTLRKNKDGRYEMSALQNALKGTDLESPMDPFGGTDNFDVSSNGIIFVSKDPSLNPGLHVKCNAYYVPLGNFTDDLPPKPYVYPVPHFQGASSSPVFSPDGKSAAFLSMMTDGYESDKNQIYLIPEVAKPKVNRLLRGDDNYGAWDHSPQNLSFSHDGKTLYFSAEDRGFGRLYSLPVHADTKEYPKPLSEGGYLSGVQPLESGNVFVSGSTLIDSSFYAIIDPSKPDKPVWRQSATKNGASLGLSRSQVSELWTPASDPKINKKVHSWVYRPSTFSATKKYPLAILIHGGPQGSWADSWSTRWNPAIFAEQGYIVVAPNPTGSTGYGQSFTDAIRRDWGGAPYADLVNVMNHISKEMPEADTANAVALGASYGGYMVNWINGHELGRRFKALVCHDGIFSFAGLLATEELYFPFYDLGGTPWGRGHGHGHSSGEGEARAPAPAPENDTAAQTEQVFGTSSMDAWARNDPSRYLAQWRTPQLVIHSSKDYRLCISEGLAAFNVLQARGIESQFLTFPDENHWVLKPENSLVWHKVVLNWVNGFVGLPKYAAEAEDGEEEEGLAFYGGVKGSGEGANAAAAAAAGGVEMPGMGKPET